MKNLFSVAATLLVAGILVTSCTKEAEMATTDQAPETRAYGSKSPKVVCFYEINDTNPLNALSYEMNGEKFVDVANLFASNIHKEADGYPTLFFNDKLAPIMAASATYIQPLRNAGIKVMLTVLGDWQGIGVANMTVDQADRFADILTYVVDQYNLDGIGFDDEYSNYSTPLVNGSYGNIIKALHGKLDQKFGVGVKSIHVFQWGNTGASQIDATAGAMIDFADQGSFGPNMFSTSSSISGVTNDRWMPQAIEMDKSYITLFLNQIKTRSAQTAADNYFGVMMFNVRKNSDRNPLPVFQKISEGAFANSAVTFTGTEYAQDWTFIPAGHTISKATVPAYLPKFQ